MMVYGVRRLRQVNLKEYSRAYKIVRFGGRSSVFRAELGCCWVLRGYGTPLVVSLLVCRGWGSVVACWGGGVADNVAWTFGVFCSDLLCLGSFRELRRTPGRRSQPVGQYFRLLERLRCCIRIWRYLGGGTFPGCCNCCWGRSEGRNGRRRGF